MDVFRFRYCANEGNCLVRDELRPILDSFYAFSCMKNIDLKQDGGRLTQTGSVSLVRAAANLCRSRRIDRKG